MYSHEFCGFGDWMLFGNYSLLVGHGISSVLMGLLSQSVVNGLDFVPD